MKWYWAVSCDNTVEDPLIVDSGELIGMDETDLEMGKVVTSWERPVLRVFIEVDEGTPDDVLQNHLALPIFSQRLRKAIESAGIDDIQYLDVDIRRRNGAKLQGFAIANIITRRPALDTTRSDIERYPDDYIFPDRQGDIRALRIPVLLGNALTGCDIVRLEEYPGFIYVSGRFRKMFERHRFTGFSFHEVAVV